MWFGTENTKIHRFVTPCAIYTPFSWSEPPCYVVVQSWVYHTLQQGGWSHLSASGHGPAVQSSGLAVLYIHYSYSELVWSTFVVWLHLSALSFAHTHEEGSLGFALIDGSTICFQSSFTAASLKLLWQVLLVTAGQTHSHVKNIWILTGIWASVTSCSFDISFVVWMSRSVGSALWLNLNLNFQHFRFCIVSLRLQMMHFSGLKTQMTFGNNTSERVFSATVQLNTSIMW